MDVPAFGFWNDFDCVSAGSDRLPTFRFAEFGECIADFGDCFSRVVFDQWLGESDKFWVFALGRGAAEEFRTCTEDFCRADWTDALAAFVEDVPGTMACTATREDSCLVAISES